MKEMAVTTYGFSVSTDSTEGESKNNITIKNQNGFRINDIAVTIIADGNEEKYWIPILKAGETWHSAHAATIDHSGQMHKPSGGPFVPFAYYEGKPQIINPALYHAETGVYEGEPHHALVWPDTDPDEKWKRTLLFQPASNVQVELNFLAKGPRVAFCGHSFTGLWDSSYYFFRELAKAMGWNAQIAYSYWGGTGISRYAGLVQGFEERASQCDALLSANDYYDYFIIAGNSDEAVEKTHNVSGESVYTHRETMLHGAQLLLFKAKQKQATLALWAPHAYQYGFLGNMSVKPWREGNVGDTYERDGKTYTLTLTQADMAKESLDWYQHMADVLGNGTFVLPVCEAYYAVTTQYKTLVDPYLKPGVECGDNGHQNNLGNYISACVCCAKIFGALPEAIVIPVSHTVGTPGGSITPEQANAICDTIRRLYLEK